MSMIYKGTQSFWYGSSYSSQSNIRNLQKQLFDQCEMISHMGFHWQNYRNKESYSSLTVTMAKHFSTNQASQAQAPTWNLS